jgi:RNA polymerase sporulation-specific sigma factor
LGGGRDLKINLLLYAQMLKTCAKCSDIPFQPAIVLKSLRAEILTVARSDFHNGEVHPLAGKVEICGVNTARLKVLKNDETTELLKKSKAGDKQAREELIAGNLRLVLSVIQKFLNRGENVDDLFQVGCIGLMKAITNFDTDLNVRFSTYGVPMIIGEIRRSCATTAPSGSAAACATRRTSAADEGKAHERHTEGAKPGRAANALGIKPRTSCSQWIPSPTPVRCTSRFTPTAARASASWTRHDTKNTDENCSSRSP